ncbi:hypothetical protein QCA50_009073 [Cerrena zonata]|uniref:BTB domain-containing protein n=1 Tax=Cerrena zonata TaxID=2478898 RepID=A0AAW0G8D5_9APHY
MEVVRRRSNPTTSPAKYADAFYNCQDGDIILRSNDIDRVDFRTYKTFLIYASPLFKTMLSLPQSQSTDSQHEIPVVEMHENAEDLRVLLMFCYPGYIPSPPASLERLHRCYGVADKYMMNNIKVWLRTCLKGLVEKKPLGVYLLSRQYKWEYGARLAAEQCLSRSLSELINFHGVNPIL